VGKICFGFGEVTKERCAPLEERWCIPRDGCPLLKRWHHPHSSYLTCGSIEELGERWQPNLSHLASSHPPSDAPLLRRGGAFLEMVAHSLKGVTIPTLHTSHVAA